MCITMLRYLGISFQDGNLGGAIQNALNKKGGIGLIGWNTIVVAPS